MSGMAFREAQQIIALRVRRLAYKPQTNKDEIESLEALIDRVEVAAIREIERQLAELESEG